MKPFWKSLFPVPWRFGIFLILAWSIPRFILVMEANRSGSYQWVSLIFITMALAPFVFLTREGRKQMGMTRPKPAAWLIVSFLLGTLACLALFLLSAALFGLNGQNWLVYLAGTYRIPPLTPDNRFVYFMIFSLVGMSFSPVGEELFYRGMVHEAFAVSLPERLASYIDAAAFAIVHLAHFGLVYSGSGWRFLTAPAMLWFIGLWAVCLLFSICRRRTSSVLGAIMAHAGFNVMMNVLIFYYLMRTTSM